MDAHCNKCSSDEVIVQSGMVSFGDFITTLSQKQSKVAFVAVAIRASTCTSTESKLLRLLISAKATQKSSPLYEQKISHLSTLT